MHTSKWIFLCLLLLLSGSMPAIAQNLLADGDFDGGFAASGWIGGTGSWSAGADAAACVLSESAAVSSAISGENQYALGRFDECITVDPIATPTLYLGGLFKTTGNVFPRIYLQFFSNAACGSHLSWSGSAVGQGPKASWTLVLAPVSVPASAASFLVWADFNPAQAGIPAFTGGWDRLYVGPDAAIFGDAFEPESGSTCRWSGAIGES